jgi:hypothetical protein
MLAWIGEWQPCKPPQVFSVATTETQSTQGGEADNVHGLLPMRLQFLDFDVVEVVAPGPVSADQEEVACLRGS